MCVARIVIGNVIRNVSEMPEWRTAHKVSPYKEPAVRRTECAECTERDRTRASLASARARARATTRTVYGSRPAGGRAGGAVFQCIILAKRGRSFAPVISLSGIRESLRFSFRETRTCPGDALFFASIAPFRFAIPDGNRPSVRPSVRNYVNER